MSESRKWGGLLRDDVGRRDWVDFVKGTAIILIVAYHTALFVNSIGLDSAGIGRVKVILELFPMPAFFLITGMFHARVVTWSFADTWRRRLRQYLYLYLLWSVIRFIFYVVAPNVRSDGAGSSASSPLALLGVLVWPISSYWFLYALFIFTLVLWLFRKAPPWVLLSIAAVVSVLSSSGILDAGNVGINRMTEYLVFFTFGAYFHRNVYSWVDRTRPWKVVALLIGFVGVGVVVSVAPWLSRIPGVALLGQVLVVASGFSMSYYLVRISALHWVVYVGVRTLNIYLVHLYIIALLIIPVMLIPGLTSLPGRGLLLIGVITGVVVTLSIVLTRYLTRVSWLFVYPFGRKSRSRALRAEPQRVERERERERPARNTRTR